MTELITLTQNQTTKLNTCTKTQKPSTECHPGNPTIHRIKVSTYFLTKKYFKKQYLLTKKHSKFRAIQSDDNNNTSINKIKQNRKRQMIWFNPPFNLKTKTKIILKSFK